LIDPKKLKRVDVNEFVSLGKNSPFKGQELIGWTVGTMVRGEWVFR